MVELFGTTKFPLANLEFARVEIAEHKSAPKKWDNPLGTIRIRIDCCALFGFFHTAPNLFA
jgi:hypothetical protein